MHFMRYCILSLALIMSAIPGGNALFAQAPPFKKSVLDSMKVNDLRWNISFAFNLSRSESQSLTSYSDAGLLYYSKRNDYHFEMSHYRDRYNRFSTANRFYVLYYMGIFSHDRVNARLKEHLVYPEPFFLHSFDANRGIHMRDQLGLNLAVNLKPTKIWRQKAGTGLFLERTDWQLIKPENLVYLDTMPDNIKRLVYDTIGITRSGTWARNNIFFNIYSNFSLAPVKNVNINGYLSLQVPFKAPYGNLPQIPDFPTVTRRYARITTNIQLTYNVWRKISILSNFTLQYDKGQVPIRVPNLVYSWTQGLQVGF